MGIEETRKMVVNSPKAQSLKDLIESSAKELGRALPEHLRPERLVRIALTNIRQNPELAKCTSESFLGALFTAAQLGVEPIAGRAYILPFNNSRKKPDGSLHTVKEAQFVLGYKAIVDLFYRHEKAINLAWGVRRQNDTFKMTLGTEPLLLHVPSDQERGEVVGYWVMANLLNGGKPFYYMTAAECLEHGKKHSKTWSKKEARFYETSPWVAEFDSMCLKTVLVQLCKILPLSIELQRAIGADESSREIRPGLDDVLDVPDQTVWEDVEKEVAEKTAKHISTTEEKESSEKV